ncbi:tyrosine-type recombinase/integrase [Lysobacter sp. Root559]|uniref:tyrosine-type recombinase/integrase n=1 Tax=Lysobacter sp. Root559 TaxID=1736559 RepID=UPI000A520DBA|nr:tyrosine-type recombinase/integrase [Lysobacter sp. Root559]
MTAVILPFRPAQAILPGAVAPPEAPARPRPPATPQTPLPLARSPRPLTEAEGRLQTRILDGYFRGFRLAQNHAPKSVSRDRAYVEEFLAFVGQPLWACTEDDFCSWAGHLGLERHLAPRSQRTMQTAVAAFWDYAVAHRAWQNEALALSGQRIETIVTRENRMVHTCDNTPVLQRTYLAADEFDRFFQILDLVIEVCAHERPRLLKDFQRDRAMIYTYYAFGIRLSEGWGINVSSFSPNPDLPELGAFGCVGVWGKGSRGSGPKFRTVPAVLPDISPMLTWYLSEIRPKFKDNTGRDRAMWLSERGARLCRASIALRYKRVLEVCGMEARLFSPHGLRHMHVSHQQTAGVPLQYTSKTVGHADGAVTERYTHLPEDYLRQVAVNIVRNSARQGDGNE